MKIRVAQIKQTQLMSEFSCLRIQRCVKSCSFTILEYDLVVTYTVCVFFIYIRLQPVCFQNNFLNFYNYY